MRMTLRLLVATGAVIAALVVLSAPASAADTAPAGKVYDMRVYNYTVALFRRFGRC